MVAGSVPAAASPLNGPWFSSNAAASAQRLRCSEQGKVQNGERGRRTDPKPRILEEKSTFWSQGRAARTPSSISAWEQERAAAPAPGRSRQQCRQGVRQGSPVLPAYQTFQQPSGHVSSTPQPQELGGFRDQEPHRVTGLCRKTRPLDACALEQGSRAGSTAPSGAQWSYPDTGA